MTTFPAKYYYEYTNRETGELLLSGTVTGINKHDCKKRAHNEALQHGLKPMMDDSIKFYIKATEDSRPGFNQSEYIAHYNKENYARPGLQSKMKNKKKKRRAHCPPFKCLYVPIKQLPIRGNSSREAPSRSDRRGRRLPPSGRRYSSRWRTLYYHRLYRQS